MEKIMNDRTRTTHAIVSALETAAGMRAGKSGIGDIARRQFAEHHAVTTAPSSAADKLRYLATLAESKRLDAYHPWAAAEYRAQHAGAIASAHALVNALQEASPERDVTVADAIAVIEATVTT